MKEKTKVGAGFVLLAVLTALVFAALLELNKNTLPAWGLCAALFVVWIALRKKLGGAGAGKRLLAWLGLAAALSLVLAFVGRPYRLRPAVEGGDGGLTEIVTLRDGQVRGVYTPDGAVEGYAGIPAALLPVEPPGSSDRVSDQPSCKYRSISFRRCSPEARRRGPF